MTETARYSAVVVIANRGCIDLVMDAARAAGATGGTVIHARGTGARTAERFFGVTLADERDIYFIVTAAEARAAIMKSIVEAAGLHTPARAIVFSLPVSQAAGFPELAGPAQGK